MLVVTLGDPHSINIEMIVRNADVLTSSSSPIVLVGSAWHWHDQCHRLGDTAVQFAAKVQQVTSFAQAHTAGLYFLDVASHSPQVPADSLSAQQRGEVACAALASLHDLQLQDQPLAVVTGPIDKAACSLAGFSHPGQTEYFAELWRSAFLMILAGPRLRVALVTTHLPLAKVAATLSTSLVTEKILLFARALRKSFGIEKPRIAVLGLNPHAGDGGLFGDEEAQIISPAVDEARKELQDSAHIFGPLPADTAFYAAYTGHYDGVLAMYHDQGLGPLKTVHFDTAVNLTGGLPHLRVSPDHGPAADLFLKQTASPSSWRTALELAIRYEQGSKPE